MAGGIGSIGSIDGHQNLLGFCGAFKDQLMVGQHYVSVGTVAERVAFLTDPDQLLDQLCKCIRLWLFKAGT
mgnify:CR=1 FL=1